MTWCGSGMRTAGISPGWAGITSPGTPAYGLEQLQATLGLEQTGTLPLGQAVFEPRALRVAAVRASLGGAASGPVFSATSARHVVSISAGCRRASRR